MDAIPGPAAAPRGRSGDAWSAAGSRPQWGPPAPRRAAVGGPRSSAASPQGTLSFHPAPSPTPLGCRARRGGLPRSARKCPRSCDDCHRPTCLTATCREPGPNKLPLGPCSVRLCPARRHGLSPVHLPAAETCPWGPAQNPGVNVKVVLSESSCEWLLRSGTGEVPSGGKKGCVMRTLVHSSHFVLPHEFVCSWAEPRRLRLSISSHRKAPAGRDTSCIRPGEEPCVA